MWSDDGALRINERIHHYTMNGCIRALGFPSPKAEEQVLWAVEKVAEKLRTMGKDFVCPEPLVFCPNSVRTRGSEIRDVKIRKMLIYAPGRVRSHGKRWVVRPMSRINTCRTA